MKSFISSALFFMAALGLNAQNLTLPPSGGNQRSEVTQYMGALAYVKIVYNSPDVNKREGKIWGQLVPYGTSDLGFPGAEKAPWRAGANECTTIEFSHDVLVQGKELKAGTYGLFMEPAEAGPWTIIFSKNSTSWGAYFYKKEEDALRIQVDPMKSEFREYLTYEFVDRKLDRCQVQMAWEEMAVAFLVELPGSKEIQVQSLRDELRGGNGFTWQAWQSAANYCARNDVNLEEALTWAENAVSLTFTGQKNFSTLSTKALVLRKLGRDEEADKVMEEAIDLPSATSFQIHAYARQLIAAGKKKEAMEIFKMNYKRFESAWPTNVGMARGHSALGEYEKAIPYAEKAFAEAPDQLNKSSMENAIKMLKEGKDIN